MKLFIRDLNGSALASREDILQIDNKNVDLGYDKSFYVAFYVKDINDKILRVYL